MGRVSQVLTSVYELELRMAELAVGGVLIVVSIPWLTGQFDCTVRGVAAIRGDHVR